MAEYTPDDEDMRKRHRYAWEQSPVNRHALGEADAQWSRWLAAHDARVRRDAYAWGRHDERMSLAYAPPESAGGPTHYPETED